MDIDFYKHRFTRAQLIEITGVPKLTLQNWLHRNTISVTPKQKGGTGNRRLFSAFDVVKISTALYLTNLLVSPSLANQIVSDDRFEQWVGFSLSHSEDEPSKYYFAILYWNNDQLVVDFIANEDQLAFFRSLNEVVSESMKV
ncbi:hypothetical protein K1W69_17845 [Hoeflea sp. WL0058]|uniref:Uncharacterized protein n=1 Tax=Flavimaribacter sediminis TaxID=2865987 RepID=A0AAE2ZLI6_9HYPH|nr:hypothetical protein [Flavimaribacter sediminis]MBW8639064.1 hypothetical protein [Flavimaribacter sediminis]